MFYFIGTLTEKPTVSYDLQSELREVATLFLPVRGRKMRATTKNQILFAVTSTMLHSPDNLFKN